MLTIILFVFGTIGLTNIIVHGKILDTIGLRPWVKTNLKKEVFELFECYECTGWWSGLLMGCFLTYDPFLLLACAFSGSVFAQFYTDMVNYIRSKTEYVVSNE